MYAPTPIRAALSEPHRFERLQRLLASGEVSSRSSASRLVCEAFDLRDGCGRLRRSSCMAALAGLEKAGRISLPASTGALPRGRPRGLPHALPPPTDVPDRVDRVAGLSLVVVDSDGGRRIWNEMMAREHPLGAAYHAGCQVRYLIGSDHGWLGGAVFGSATRAQRARDEWIGWSREQRQAGVHLVIGLSRFLIRPMVHCHNLASRALGLCLRRVAADYEAAWGFCPVLVESYVGPEHSGASYKAAGWTRVGDTAGIGRRGGPVAVKSVFLRPLCGDWRARLGAVAAPVAPLAPWAGLDGAVWAENEFGGALPGDARLSKRLVRQCGDSGFVAVEDIFHGGIGGPGGGDGVLPNDRTSRRNGDLGGDDPGGASGADPAAASGAIDGASGAGRQGPEFRDPHGVRRPRQDQPQQGVCGHSRAAHAHLVGGRGRWGSAGGRAH